MPQVCSLNLLPRISPFVPSVFFNSSTSLEYDIFIYAFSGDKSYKTIVFKRGETKGEDIVVLVGTKEQAAGNNNFGPINQDGNKDKKYYAPSRASNYVGMG